MTKNKSLGDLLEILEAFKKDCIRVETGKVIGGMHLSLRQAKEEIHQSLLSLIPEKKYDTDANDLRAGTFKRGQDKYRIGYNQAIRDLEKSVREWVNRHYSPK